MNRGNNAFADSTMAEQKKLSDEELQAIGQATLVMMKQLTEKQKPQASGLIYFWLFISWVLNITGLASIVDGLVVWVDFFKNIILIYRRLIRDPLLLFIKWALPVGWPTIPGWCADVLTMYSGLILAASAMFILEHGYKTSLFSQFIDKQHPIKSSFKSIAITLMMPFFLLFGFMFKWPWSVWSKSYYKYLATTLIAFLLVLFVNFQLTKR
jgi:hypothetical protein